MTRNDPSLFLRRVIVTQKERIAYDQNFHKGLNIIRGDNSSGKSTIADLVAFGLGADITNWKPEALLCSEVLVEVSINGEAATFKRSISKSPRQSMSIAWTSIERSVSGNADWKQYPYAQTEGKAGFSTEIFRALGLPEARGELASRLTMHQVLRLAYVDQVTPVNQVFRIEAFDNELMREAVGAFVCGVYDSEHYDIELKIRETSAALEETRGQIKAEERFLGEYVDPVHTARKLKKTDAERERLIAEIESAKARKWTPGRLEARQQRDIEEVRALLNKSEADLNEWNIRRRQLDLEVADSELFIIAIKSHLMALDESGAVYEALGEAKFDFCPACYSHVNRMPHNNACYLCLQPFHDGPEENLVARRRSELSQQLAESMKLQEIRRRKLADVNVQIAEAAIAGRMARQRYARLAVDSSPEAESVVQELSRKLGYIERETEELRRKLQMAETLSNLRVAATALESLLQQLESKRSEHENARRARQLAAQVSISENTIALLNKDLEREDGFVSAKNVQYSFGKNVILVDGREHFSASSSVVLKNAFHSALLMSSVELPFFRYPRFLMIDNTEDKGMEEIRSHNFQNLLARWSDAQEVEHQIILTTSMLSPPLNVPKYVVGEHYRLGRKSLNVVQP